MNLSWLKPKWYSILLAIIGDIFILLYSQSGIQCLTAAICPGGKVYHPPRLFGKYIMNVSCGQTCSVIPSLVTWFVYFLILISLFVFISFMIYIIKRTINKNKENKVTNKEI